MAAAGDRESTTGEKIGCTKEGTGKRGRGRPRKGEITGGEAEMMKRFLESKDEEKVFLRSGKVQRTPEKSIKKGESMRERRVGDEGNYLTDGKQEKDKGDETDEDVKEAGRGELTPSEGGSSGEEEDGDINDGGESGDAEKKKEEAKKELNEGMCEKREEWMKTWMERMSELENRLQEALDRLERERRRER